MTNQLFTDGYGRFTTDRYSFRDHVDGTLFRHKAAAIDLNPTLTINATPVSTVQAALAATELELGVLELSGKGFITIGDGFDTYHFSDPEDPGYDPDAPYDSSIPAFDGYLDNLLNITDPLDVDYNSLHSRIRSGGIVLIKAGTYKFTGSVNVPPGIILMGEGYGTRIVNQMASPTPLFIIKADLTRVADNGVDVNTFIFSKFASFVNLTIADNFLEPKFLGDLGYKTPINNDNITPLISIEDGANFICENTNILGKVAFSSGTVVSDITSFAIKLDTTIPSTTGTYLKVNNCSIDGFAQPISFNSLGGRNDYLNVINSKIRSHGYLNSDGTTQENNCIIHMNDNNAVITDNDFYSNHDTAFGGTICYVKNVISPLPADGDKANIVVASNELVVGRGGLTFGGDPIIVDSTIAGIFDGYAYILAHGNICQAGFSVITTALPGSPDSANTQIYADTNNIVIGLASNITIQASSAATITATSTTDITSPTTTVTASTALNLNSATTTITSPTTDIIAGTALNLTSPNITSSLTSTTIVATGSGAVNLNTATNGGTITLNGGVFVRTHTITSATYAIDSGGTTDYIILADSSGLGLGINFDITLPAPTNGRVIIIKDTLGTAVSHNIIIHPNGSEKIDNAAGNKTFNTDFVCKTLVANGTDWFIC